MSEGRLTPWRLTWAAGCAYAAGFAALSVLRNRAFHTGRFDLGNMIQAVWTTAHGHPLQMTSLHGEQISRLAAHFDPILALFAPLWWIWPSGNLLLTAQAIAVAAGVFPVFWLTRKHLASERAALGFALAYLVYPPVQWLTVDEFHPVALACPLLLFAFWYLDEDRLLPFALFAAAAVVTKEEIGLAVGAMGIWYGISRRRWRAGAVILAAGVAVSLLAVEVIVPHFNQQGRFHFFGRYKELGDSPGTILKTLFHHPLRTAGDAFDGRGARYLVQLSLPLAGLFVLAPLVLVAALPELALSLLSNTPTQRSIHFHYTAAVIPALVVGAIFGVERLRRWRTGAAVPAAAVALAATLVGNYVLGPLPVWRDFPGGADLQARYWHYTRHDAVAAEAVRLIPPQAPVSATNGLGAHLSARRTFLAFPRVQGADWVAVDETQLSYAARGLSPVLGAHRLVRLRGDPAWRVVFERDGVVVFRRVRAGSSA